MRGPLPLVTLQALPEGQDWRDEGCSYWPRCLACPLAACRWDGPGASQRAWRWARGLGSFRADRPEE